MRSISSKIITGEVVNTVSAYEYTETDTSTPRVLPYGTILVRFREHGRRYVNSYAYPMSSYDIQIPKVGEMVYMYKSITKDSKNYSPNLKLYYANTVNVHDLLPENKMEGFSFHDTREDDLATGAMKKEDVEKNIQKLPVIPRLQPYEGDRFIQSRFGSLIRFSSNNTKDRKYKSKRPERDLTISYEQKTPPWKGTDDDSPIIMITNGYDTSKESYSIESPEDDNSLIYLTSDQTVNINSSQRNLGLGVAPSNTFDDPQVIISSDRVLINAKDEQVILSGNESVTVATPNWAMDMNDFFNAFEDLVKELEKTANAQSPYGTGVGPTTPNPGLIAGIAKIKAVLSTMKQ
jgi:hypothetical protein